MAEYTKEILRQDEEEGDYISYTMLIDGEEIGEADIILTEDAYVDRIDIEGGKQGQGFGTEFLMHLREEYGEIFLAPDNGGAQRLYERLGDDVSSIDPWWGVDQGYGVYRI